MKICLKPQKVMHKVLFLFLCSMVLIMNQCHFLCDQMSTAGLGTSGALTVISIANTPTTDQASVDPFRV